MRMNYMKISPPYVGIKRVVRIMRTLQRNMDTQKSLLELAVLLDSSVSSIQNAVSTLKTLDLAYTEDESLVLTERGVDFCDALRTNNNVKARSIISEAIEQDEILSFSLSLVDERGAIKDSELGQSIARKFNKKWKSTKFIQSVGSACASIISYAGNAYWKDGVLSTGSITQEIELPLYPPELYYNGLADFLRIISRYHQVTSTDLTEKEDVPKDKISGYLAVAETLGMIEKGDYDAYCLTVEGSAIADLLVSENKKIEVFREALVASPYIEVARRLVIHNKEFNANTLGEALGFWMNRRWKGTVQNHYGKKLLNWFRFAEISERISKGTYKIIPLRIKDIYSESLDYTIQSPNKKELDRYYTIGYLLGHLQGLVVEEKDLAFNDALTALTRKLSEYNDISVLLESLSESFDVAMEIEQPMVYLRSLQFLTKKIQQKLELTDMG